MMVKKKGVESMNSKQRIKAAMDPTGNPPDRIPFDGLLPWRSDQFTMLQVTPSSWQPREGYYPYVPQQFLQLKIYKWHPTWDVPKDWKQQKRTAMDEWGCYWNYAKDDPTKGHPGKPAFETWDDLDDWEPPDGSNPKRYRTFGRFSKLFFRKFKIGMLDSFLFSRCQYIRGFSTILIDFRRNPDKVHALIEKMVPFYLDAIKAWSKYNADAVFCMDDMGAQDRPFVSPKIYREFFKEPFKRIVNHAHDHEMSFILHSCGNNLDLMPIWIDEIGVDAFQFDSPRMNGLDNLAKFKGKTCFWNVVDIQTIYPFATPAQIEDEVKVMIDKLATPNGGLVLRDYFGAHSVLNAPKENVKMFQKAAKKYGKYPLN